MFNASLRRRGTKSLTLRSDQNRGSREYIGLTQMHIRGFTLIELCVVLVLVGLLVAFSPLALDSMVAERELESEASRSRATA